MTKTVPIPESTPPRDARQGSLPPAWRKPYPRLFPGLSLFKFFLICVAVYLIVVLFLPAFKSGITDAAENLGFEESFGRDVVEFGILMAVACGAGWIIRMIGVALRNKWMVK